MGLSRRRHEELLSSALRQLGPVITVGRPGDPFGFGGAARSYVSEDNWRCAIQYLLMHCAAVVIIIGRGESLWWEIDMALKTVPRENLLFFLPFVRHRKAASLLGESIDFVTRWNMLFVSISMKADR
jgi:hypothetical protein